MKKFKLSLLLVAFAVSLEARTNQWSNGDIIVTNNGSIRIVGTGAVYINGTNVTPFGAVTNNQPDSVTSAMIVDGAVTNADLAANAVTSAKISDGTVTNADISADAITSSKIFDGSVTNADLSANAVTSAKIADGTIILGTDTLTDAGALTNLPVQALRITNSFVSGYVLTSTSGTNFFWTLHYTTLSQFGGQTFDASGATNLNATELRSGTVADARLSANVSLLGSLIQLGTETDLNGALVTNLNGSSIASGTVSDSRLSANVSLLGSLIQLGTETDLDGASVTNLNGSSIASGTVPDARLSANVVTNNRPSFQTPQLLLLSNAWLQVDSSGTNLLFIANLITNRVDVIILP